MARCKDCIHEVVCSALIEKGLPWNDGEYPAEAFCMTFVNKADVVPKSEVEDAKIKAVASVISEIAKMLKSSYNRKHAFVNDEFLRGRDDAYQEFIDILTEISRKNAEGDK